MRLPDPATLVTWPWRSYDEVSVLSPRVVMVDGHKLVQACSTQYLSMLWRTSVRERLEALLAREPATAWGAVGSAYLGGSHPARKRLECKVAEACGTEAAIYFASGWAANYAVGELMSKAFKEVIVDRRIHNSLIHGLRSGKAIVRKVDLPTLSETAVERPPLLAPTLEGLSGEWSGPSQEFRSDWIADECHSFGAVGSSGLEPWEGTPPVARVVGFSKALGFAGAAVCGSSEFVSLLSQVASPWMFSTAVPPIHCCVVEMLLDELPAMRAERDRIHQLARRFRARMADCELRCSGDYHITGVHVPSRINAERFEQRVRQCGFYVKVSKYPSRPADDSCARIAFNPFHEDADVDELAAALIDAETTAR